MTDEYKNKIKELLKDNPFKDIDLFSDSQKISLHNNGFTPEKILINYTKNNYLNKEEDLRLRFLEFIKDRKINLATEIIVEYILENNFIFTTKEDLKSEMWVYKEGIYVPNGKSEIKEIMRKILKSSFSPWYANLALAKIEADTFIDSKDFFKIENNEEIPVQNGILNIFSRKISDFTPNKIFFNKIPVVYNSQQDCPKIESFLKDVLAKEQDILIFYELGGSALFSKYKYEKAFMFHGSGRNGKGKTLDLLKKVFGVENCSAIPLSSLKADSFQISELFGKILNLGGDIDSRALKDMGIFKSLTGRDLISAKRKFQTNIVFENFAKFIFACNELPMIYDNSKGFWERWILLDFPYYFVEKDIFDNTPPQERLNWKIKDPSIIDKITTPDELSGLFNKFLDGLDRLEHNNGFSVTEGSEEIKNLWVRKANSFIAFCLDKLQEDVNGMITKKLLRKEFNKYCKKYKIKGSSDQNIKNTLQEFFGVISNYKTPFGQLEQEHVWEGITWQ